MTHIQFGFVLPAHQLGSSPREAYLTDLHAAMNLVSGHFDSAWVIDHLQDGEAGLLESFTTLSFLAALYPQLKFGQAVLCQSFRNPALVAKMGATVQFLSGGRFRLGLGAGWNEAEYKAYGYDFPAAGTRVEQLEEALQIIQALWSHSPASFTGKHYRMANAVCAPKPEPIPPIMVGAFRPRMLRLAARYADEWNVSSTSVSRYRRLIEAFEKECLRVGRDPSTVRRSWGGGCVCAPTQAQVERLAGGRYTANTTEDDFDFVGTPPQVVEQMHAFMDLGVETFMLDCGGFPDLTTLEMLVNEVLPVMQANT